MEEYKALQQMKVEIVSGSFTIASKGPDAQMPPWLMPIIQQLVPNITIPIAKENEEMQEQIQAEEQQQAMMQQQLAQMSPEDQQQFMQQMQGG
jgi:hypothetical protein